MLINKIFYKLNWVISNITWLFFTSLILKNKKKQSLSITIGITTFMDRYHNSLKPLLKKIVVLFPNDEIIIVANGHVKKGDHLKYLEELEAFCKNFHNVKLIKYIEPKGLSYIWNRIIDASINEKTLLLNDDLDVSINFYKSFLKMGIINEEIATINKSWSHFIISKKIFRKIGYFDEGLLEIGGEDDDYLARLAIDKIKLSNYKTNTIRPKLILEKKRLILNSYGKNMNKEIHGYSNYNTHYLEEKWQMSNDYFEGAIDVPNRTMRFWKLKTKLPINNKEI